MRIKQLFKRAEAGQSLIELAISLNVLLLIFAGLFDLSRGFQAYIIIVNAAREGASAAGNREFCTQGTIVTKARAAAKQEAHGSGIALEDSHITVCVNGNCPPPNNCKQSDIVTVRIDYNLGVVLGSLLGFNTLPLTYTFRLGMA